jgi:membrane protein DedA with SNARE-associated domain
VRIFGEILHFFERWNNWGGWGIFIGLFIANVTLFLPGVALILGAGFIFGCVLRLVNQWVEY